MSYLITSRSRPRSQGRLAAQRIFMSGLRVASIGWALMLLLGNLHHDVSPHVPALSYWASAGYTFLLMTILGSLAADMAQDIRTNIDSEQN
jgi:hypothetical protein